MTLPVNVDSSYDDDAGDPSVKAHQQHHDALHGLYNSLEGVSLATDAEVAAAVAAEATARDSAIATHAADTTAVHGIADTTVLATDAEVAAAVAAEATARDAAIETHRADTTNVHGIADTSALATSAGVTAAVAAEATTRDAAITAASTADRARANHTGTQAASTITGLATVATSGAYADLSGNPTLGTAAAAATTDFDPAGAAAAAQAASQPLDSDLTAIAALSTTSFGRALLALADAAAGRTAFGLGTAATSASGDFQPSDSDLTAIAALTTTAFGRGFLDLADAAAGRTKLGLGTAATSAATAFEPADGRGAKWTAAGNRIAVSNMPNWSLSSNSPTTSGDTYLCFATVHYAGTFSQIRFFTGTTAAATVTSVKFGLYSVDANGDGTLLSTTADDTTIFTATGTAYTRSLAASQALTLGQRVAIAFRVAATTLPTVVGGVTPPNVTALRLEAAGLTDATEIPTYGRLLAVNFPATFLRSSVASPANAPSAPYGVLLP